MFFKSDNTTGASQEILTALVEANHKYSEPYGKDIYNQKLNRIFSEIFETDVHHALVSTGTAANSLALSAMTSGHGSIFSHHSAHIYTDECGAPSLFTDGAKFSLIEGMNGKISVEDFEQRINTLSTRKPNGNKPSVLSITQATEAGTVYTAEEIKALTQLAKKNGMFVHMDGARFTNALVSLDRSPADLTWKSGVDVLCFGATKNGGIAAEAILFFNERIADEFEYRQKRGAQMFSKAWFFAAQMNAYLANDLWLKNARHANSMANYLKAELMCTGLAKILHPVEANEIFVELPESLIEYLFIKGAKFYEWENNVARFVTSFRTSLDDIRCVMQLFEEYKQLLPPSISLKPLKQEEIASEEQGAVAI